MLAIMKSMWTAAIPVYLRRIEYAALHPHENSDPTSVYIEKATYQMSGGQERRRLWLIITP